MCLALTHLSALKAFALSIDFDFLFNSLGSGFMAVFWNFSSVLISNNAVPSTRVQSYGLMDYVPMGLESLGLGSLGLGAYGLRAHALGSPGLGAYEILAHGARVSRARGL